MVVRKERQFCTAAPLAHGHCLGMFFHPMQPIHSGRNGARDAIHRDNQEEKSKGIAIEWEPWTEWEISC